MQGPALEIIFDSCITSFSPDKRFQRLVDVDYMHSNGSSLFARRGKI
jgi:hypothetical protein